MRNKGDYLHLVNIVLMIATLIMAIRIPFELFLVGYAVLGPLHYLTEINWLNEKQFYIKNRNRIWIIVGLTILISLPVIGAGVLPGLSEYNIVQQLLKYLSRAYGSIILISFIISIGLVSFRDLYKVVLLIAAGIVIVFFFRNAQPYQQLTVLLLPTIIHVYIFTLIFMVYGVTKTKSKIGIIEILLLLIVPVIIIYFPINPASYSLSSATLATFMESNFGTINFGLGKMLGVKGTQKNEAFIFSELGIRIQIFIAFAYLYHYINWFSKVSLIGWLKNTSKEKLTLMILFWIGSFALYLYDFRSGLSVLFFLSLLHVTLEFPLNVVSIKGVLSFMRNRFSRSKE